MSHAQTDYESNLDEESSWNHTYDCLQAVTIILQVSVFIDRFLEHYLWRIRYP